MPLRFNLGIAQGNLEFEMYGLDIVQPPLVDQTFDPPRGKTHYDKTIESLCHV